MPATIFSFDGRLLHRRCRKTNKTDVVKADPILARLASWALSDSAFVVFWVGLKLLEPEELTR
jgi:hypothetical protein